MTKEFGQALRFLREDKRLTQRSIAKSLNFTPAILSNIETGKLNANPEIAQKIAKILEIPQEKLAEFYLLAVGFSKEAIEEALKLL